MIYSRFSVSPLITHQNFSSSQKKKPTFNIRDFFTRYNKGMHAGNRKNLERLIKIMCEQGATRDEAIDALSSSVYNQAIGANWLAEEKAFRLDIYKNDLLPEYTGVLKEINPFDDAEEEFDEFF